LTLFVSLLLFALAPVAPAVAAPANGGAEYGAKPAPEQESAPAPAPGQTGGANPSPPTQPGTGPLPGSPNPVVPGTRAKLLADGTAAAPAAAPAPVQKAIWAANALQSKPYRYGGGHGSFEDSGYDCSGTISFALNAAGVLPSPLDSSSFMRWGEAGRGAWMTVYSNPGHAYVVIAGLRLDTSAAFVRARSSRRHRKAAEKGPRWRPCRRPSRGFTVRHPAGL